MSTTPIDVPFVDLASQHAEVKDEVEAGIARVFAATSFVDGPPVADFEQQYAAFIGVGHCVGVGNGTDALELALRAAGVEPRGEVVLPVNTFIATAEAVSRIGATPVVVDCDDDRLLIDPDLVGRGDHRPDPGSRRGPPVRPARADGPPRRRSATRPACRWSRTPPSPRAPASTAAARGGLSHRRRHQLLPGQEPGCGRRRRRRHHRRRRPSPPRSDACATTARRSATSTTSSA